MQGYVEIRDRLDHRGPPASKVRPVRPGQMVLLEPGEKLVPLAPKETLVLRAQRVLLAPRVPPGHRVRLAQLDRQAQRASRALQEARAPKV